MERIKRKLDIRKRGRKPKYDSKTPYIVERYIGVFSDSRESLYKLWELLGISETTYYKWRLEKPEFKAAILRGRDSFVGDKAELALVDKMVGYEYDEVTKERVALRDSDGKLTGKYHLVETRRITKKAPPDTSALIFYLKNREPERWKDTKEINNKISGGILNLSKEVKEIDLSSLSKKELVFLRDTLEAITKEEEGERKLLDIGEKEKLEVPGGGMGLTDELF